MWFEVLGVIAQTDLQGRVHEAGVSKVSETTHPWLAPVGILLLHRVPPEKTHTHTHTHTHKNSINKNMTED